MDRIEIESKRKKGDIIGEGREGWRTEELLMDGRRQGRNQKMEKRGKVHHSPVQHTIIPSAELFRVRGIFLFWGN